MPAEKQPEPNSRDHVREMLGKLYVVQHALAGMRGEDAYPPVELAALAHIVDDVCADLGDLAYGEGDVSE